MKHLQHPFLYISHQVEKKEGKGKDEGNGRPDPVNSMADQQKEKATALPADKKNQSPDTSPGDFFSALLQQRETKIKNKREKPARRAQILPTSPAASV